jgi:hypothetical protein
MQEKVAMGAGLEKDEIRRIFDENYREFFKKINY